MKVLSYLLVTLSVLLFSSSLVSSQVTWEIDPSTTLSTTEAAGTISIYVTPSAPVTETVTYNFTNINATLGSDYSDASGGTLSWSGTADNQTVTINILQDTTYEGTETFTINFYFDPSDTPTTFSLTVAIADDDTKPVVSIGTPTPPAAIPEGTSVTPTVKNITVFLNHAAAGNCQFAYSLTAASAFANLDYVPAQGLITFPAGTVSQVVAVTVLADALDEDNEVFIFGLQSTTPTWCAVNANPLVYAVTIVDDDAVPTLSFVTNSSAVVEGNTGTAPNLYFNVTVTPVSGRSINVTYVTNNGTGMNGIDFLAGPTSLVSIPSGLSWANLFVRVIGDNLYEPNKTLSITIASVVNADPSFVGITANGLIIDDDAIPVLSIFNATAVEGDSGTSTLLFTISSPTKTPSTLTLYYNISALTADSSDVVLGEFSATITPGSAATTAVASIIGDLIPENLYEYFTVSIINATAGGYSPKINSTFQTAYGTIIDNDELPQIFVKGGQATEGVATYITYNISLPYALAANVDFDYETVDVDPPSTATPGADYTSVSSSATILAGSTYVLVNVTGIVDDSIPENTEYVYLNVTAVTSNNAQLNSSSISFGSIFDNDYNFPTIFLTNSSSMEGNNGTTPVQVDVWINATSERSVIFTWSTKDESGYSPNQYLEGAGTITIPGGSTNATIVVYIVGDTIIESDMTFTVKLNNVTGAFIGNSTAGVLIVDDDELTTITVQSDEYHGSPRFNPRFISLVIVIAVVVVLIVSSIVGFFALKRYVS